MFKCEGCATSIAVNLLKLNGINDVQMSDGTAEVSFTYTHIKELAIAERRLTQLGFPPERADNKFTHKAKSYVSCMVGNLNN